MNENRVGYLITKTIDKRFVYYYGKNGSWQGLKSNGIIYYGLFATRRDIEILKEAFPDDKFNYITIEIIKGDNN